MATSRANIREWFERGIDEEATHMIVVCDTFDHEDYPVFVSAGQDARKVASGYNGENMQRVMEVYNLSMDMEEQLRERRANNY